VSLLARGEAIVPAEARGTLLRLTEPLSLWGGVDPASGRIVDAQHPQRGALLAGRVVAMPGGAGSSSSSSVLLECVRAGTAPEALLLERLDAILPVGAAVAHELYGRGPAVVRVVLPELPDGTPLQVDPSGRVTLSEPTTQEHP
jgi:predicted aconitase with swiveling domain